MVTAEYLGHWVTDTGFCAQGCPVCRADERRIEAEIRAIESKKVEEIDWEDLTQYLDSKKGD